MIPNDYVICLQITDEVGTSGLNIVNTRFTFLNVKDDSFQDYQLILSNSIGQASRTFTLKRGQCMYTQLQHFPRKTNINL